MADSREQRILMHISSEKYDTGRGRIRNVIIVVIWSGLDVSNHSLIELAITRQVRRGLVLVVDSTQRAKAPQGKTTPHKDGCVV